MRVEGVVLAAGLSSRMGDNKLMKTIDHMPMIERVIANMIPFCERIIVVVGHRRDELAKVLQKYKQVEIVVNDDYQSGMFSSVKAGCKAIRGDRFFFDSGRYAFCTKGDLYGFASSGGRDCGAECEPESRTPDFN